MQGFLRNKDFILRKEYFGGIGFNKRDAITLELDEEAYFLLRILEDPLDLQQMRTRLMYHFNRGFSDEGLQLALKDLVDYNCVDKVETVDYSPERDLADYPVEGYLSAPETVHLSITSRCNRDCPFCYESKEREEMETDQILRLVDELSSLRVFQLAIGGGEPLLRGDLLEIVQHCNDRNIVPNLTTNGSLLTKSFIEELSGRSAR